MSLTTAVLLFLGGLILSMASSAVLTVRLEQIGRRLRISAGLLGIITALGADAPEITSAATALLGGQHNLGRGVIFGSNIFNIVAPFGLCALVTGRIRISKPNLALNAGVALWLTLAVSAQALGWLSSLATGILIVAVAGPYVILTSLPSRRLSALRLPDTVTEWLARSIFDAEKDSDRDEDDSRPLTRMDGFSILPLAAIIILTSLVIGARLPTLLIALPPPSRQAVLAICWLIGITVGATILGIVGRGFSRWSGGLLVASYAFFAGMVIW